MGYIVEHIGKKIIAGLEELGKIAALLQQIIVQGAKKPFNTKHFVQQLVAIGVDTIPIVSLMSVFVGMVLGYLAYLQFKMVELEMYTGSLVAASLTMELGPVMTAIIVSGRIGSATAAEIGTMKVTEQIDALRTLATDPIKYLAVPRFYAALVMLPILTVFSDIIGMFGGYMIGVWKFGIRHQIYIQNSIDFLRPVDIINGLVKTIIFGGLIITISCYKGFTCTGGAEGVGKATTAAVVLSIMTVLVSDFLLTMILY
ncbi:MAG: ABC transporter permease [Candidatus Desantisbacteria bacterium]